eukprot:COSAG02_NODE_1759_length_11042_cov_3.648725_4_plen_54_part_00
MQDLCAELKILPAELLILADLPAGEFEFLPHLQMRPQNAEQDSERPVRHGLER